MSAVEFNCAGCGAELRFEPGEGESSLTCAHCGAANDLPELPAAAAEQDFEAAIASLESNAQGEERLVVECRSCGARVEFGENVTSQSCCYCGTPIVATGASVRVIKPNAVLPFQVTTGQAGSLIEKWIRSRWFAPAALKRLAVMEGRLAGVYLPYWTFDTRTTTRYVGQRGEHYYVSVPYTVMVNGRPSVRMRQERRTRWYPASGVVRDRFNDFLVSAGSSLDASRVARLEPWDLAACVAYSDQYLAGHRAESYRVGLGDGFGLAKSLMQPRLRAVVCGDIGGDEQRIIRMQTEYADITFKHVLLPVWICGYRFRQKAYQVLVNARTGEIIGQRPYSAWKIAGLAFSVLALAALAAGAVVLAAR